MILEFMNKYTNGIIGGKPDRSFFREQAEQYWKQREAEWDRERTSRNKLLQAVLDERQEKVENRNSKI